MVLWLAGFPNSWSDCSHLGQAMESPFQHITLNALPFNLSANPETVWHCLSWDTRFSMSPKALSSFWLRMGYCLHSSFQSFSSTTRVWAGRNANWHRTGTQRTLVQRLSVPSHLLALLWPNHRTKQFQIGSLVPTDFCCSCQLGISKMASHPFLRSIFRAHISRALAQTLVSMRALIGLTQGFDAGSLHMEPVVAIKPKEGDWHKSKSYTRGWKTKNTCALGKMWNQQSATGASESSSRGTNYEEHIQQLSWHHMCLSFR